MPVCVFACVHASERERVRVLCVHACMRSCLCVLVGARTSVRQRLRAHVCVCVCVCEFTCVCARVQACA